MQSAQDSCTATVQNAETKKIFKKRLDNRTATVLLSKHPEQHGNRATILENLHGHRPGKNTGGVS